MKGAREERKVESNINVESIIHETLQNEDSPINYENVNDIFSRGESVIVYRKGESGVGFFSVSELKSYFSNLFKNNSDFHEKVNASLSSHDNSLTIDPSVNQYTTAILPGPLTVHLNRNELDFVESIINNQNDLCRAMALGALIAICLPVLALVIADCEDDAVALCNNLQAFRPFGVIFLALSTLGCLWASNFRPDREPLFRILFSSVQTFFSCCSQEEDSCPTGFSLTKLAEKLTQAFIEKFALFSVNRDKDKLIVAMTDDDFTKTISCPEEWRQQQTTKKSQ